MPQLDSSTYTSQVFWLFLCFLVVYFLLKNWIIPRLENAENMHSKKIESIMLKAEQTQEKTAELLKEYQHILDGAKKESIEMITKTREKINLSKIELEHEIGGWLKSELKSVEEKLDKEKALSEKNIALSIDEIADLLVEKIQERQSQTHIEEILIKRVIN